MSFVVGLLIGALLGILIAELLRANGHAPTLPYDSICNAGLAQPCSYPRCNCGEGRK